MIRKALLAAVLVAALGPLALAQRGGGGGGGGGGMGMPGGFGGRGPAVDKMETIAKELKLTDAQKTDVEAILDGSAKQTTDLLKKLGDLRQVIMNQNLNGVDPAANLKQLADIGAQLDVMEVDAITKVVAKLDDKQKAKAPKLYELLANGFVSGNWRTVR